MTQPRLRWTVLGPTLITLLVLTQSPCAQTVASPKDPTSAGGSPITPPIARKILTQLQSKSSPPCAPVAARDEVAELSKRETEVLHLISKGLSFDEVSASMDISTHTVVAHTKKIYRKLAVHSRSEAVYEAGQRGLL